MAWLQSTYTIQLNHRHVNIRANRRKQRKRRRALVASSRARWPTQVTCPCAIASPRQPGPRSAPCLSFLCYLLFSRMFTSPQTFWPRLFRTLQGATRRGQRHPIFADGLRLCPSEPRAHACSKPADGCYPVPGAVRARIWRRQNIGQAGFGWSVCWESTASGRRAWRAGSGLKNGWNGGGRRRLTPRRSKLCGARCCCGWRANWVSIMRWGRPRRRTQNCTNIRAVNRQTMRRGGAWASETMRTHEQHEPIYGLTPFTTPAPARNGLTPTKVSRRCVL